MFKRVLIANRGEIAVRVIRACKEMGINSIAVYSEADKESLHVRLADEAICIGPAQAEKSYLSIPSVISAAELTGAEAIHPGYGFLAENAQFSEICASCGIVFIGPPPEVIEEFGDKATARQIMVKAGIPVIPGTDGVIEKERDALSFAKRASYPVMIKAAGGGGGRGMRIVHNDRELRQSLHTAQSEAGTSFNNSGIYIEKYIEEPRHVEFQILADMEGNVVHLGERDCSIQRRHQKLVEESPCPFLSSKQRARMGKAAVRAVRAARYVGAGTIEFLVDKEGNFYFIEANTRIQVEHPVTEMVTGIDVVKEQIRIAAGEKLSYSQGDISTVGHAIEFRINAENPDDNFKPMAGKVELYNPPGGPGIRVDSHVYSGYTIPPFYDSLLAKLITWGRTRDEAISKARGALREFVITGRSTSLRTSLKTTISFHQRVVENAAFVQGEVFTDFVERHMGA